MRVNLIFDFLGRGINNFRMRKIKHKPPRHVAFAYVGPLGTRGRLLKQIATLQAAGVSCELIHGSPEPDAPNPDDFSFPFQSIPVDLDSGKICSFYNQMKFGRKASKIIAASKADAVVCVAIDALMAGVWAKKIRPGLRMIFDNNELHIESFGSSLKRRVWKLVHNYGVKRCDVILHAEKNRLEYFQQHYPGKDTPQYVIENFPWYEDKVPERPSPDEVVKIIYLGGFGNNRFTEEIVDIFSKFDQSIQLDIVGFGRESYVDSIKERIKGASRGNVRVLPAVPYRDIPKLLENYHIGVALYRNTNLNNYYCAPNKVYDYLMNGMPVIANRYPGLVSVLEENKVGACIDEVSFEAVEKAINSILEEKRWNNINDDLRRKYSWEKQEAGYLDILGLESPRVE